MLPRGSGGARITISFPRSCGGNVTVSILPPFFVSFSNFMFTDSEKAELLSTARLAIEHAAKNQPLPRNGSGSPALMQRLGTFVTLYSGGELRGCIGALDSEQPLLPTIQEVAIKSATRDPRFPPIAPYELASLQIEISVLSPLTQISSIDEIIIGTHGLVFELGFARGVLLPQVPIEHGWDKETFLRETARKAGCPPDAWKKSGARLYTFSSEV